MEQIDKKKVSRPKLVRGAKENLKIIREKIDEFAKKNLFETRFELCEEDYLCRIKIDFRSYYMTLKDVSELVSISDKIRKMHIRTSFGSVIVEIDVNYFVKDETRTYKERWHINEF